MITAVLDHRDDLDLVGALVYSEAKNGVDIGTLVGREPIGVTATTDVEQILKLDADCVLYTPRTARLDDVCRLLESGKNVVTTAFLFHPARIDPSDRDRVLAACEKGGQFGARQRPQPRQPVRRAGAGAVGHEPDDRQDHPAGARRLVGLREHRNHLRQHGIRSARRRDQPHRDRLPGVQQLDLRRTGLVSCRRAERRHRRRHRHRGGRRGRRRITRSSTICWPRARRPGSAGTGSGVATGNRSSRSKRCGRWAASIPATGPNPSTAGR